MIFKRRKIRVIIFVQRMLMQKKLSLKKKEREGNDQEKPRHAL